MKKLFIVVIATFTLWLNPYNVFAADIHGLYEAEVPVFGQDQEQRDEAMQSALLEVLIKVSGSGDIANRPEMAEFLAKPSQFVEQYRYRNRPSDKPFSEGENSSTQLLWVSFDKQAINKLLTNKGLPIWGHSRPTVLVWLAIQDQGDRYLLGTGSSSSEFQVALQHAAQRRGLPFLLPLLDLQDQISLKVSDVWGDFQEQILKASARYQTEAILVGRIYQDAGLQWHAQWGLYANGDRLHWELEGPSQDFVLDGGVGGAADALAQRYAQVVLNEGTQDAFTIMVTDVHSLSDYARLTKYLESLASVRNAQAVLIDKSNITFRLNISSSQQGVAQTIALGSVLVPASTEGNTTNPQPNGVDRQYRLLP